MHNSFTPKADPQESPQPESFGGWQATLFRAVKVPAAAMSSKHESAIFDIGEDGENGKGVLAFALSQVFDGYYEDIPLGTVRDDPPTGGKVSPEVFKLKGSHFLGTPESESSITIKSIWLKQLADQSTIWTARGLYKDSQSFGIPALWAMSSNLRVKLSSIDGGVRRRLRGCHWPISFKTRPDGPFQRERSEHSLKSSDFYTMDVKAGILHMVLAGFTSFFVAGGVGIEHMPAVIQKATSTLLVQEYGEYVEEFLEECTDPCSNAKEGTTKVKLCSALKAHIQRQLPEGEKVNAQAFTCSLDSHCTTKIPYGVVERLHRISTAKYIKLKPHMCV